VFHEHDNTGAKMTHTVTGQVMADASAEAFSLPHELSPMERQRQTALAFAVMQNALAVLDHEDFAHGHTLAEDDDPRENDDFAENMAGQLEL